MRRRHWGPSPVRNLSLKQVCCQVPGYMVKPFAIARTLRPLPKSHLIVHQSARLYAHSKSNSQRSNNVSILEEPVNREAEVLDVLECGPIPVIFCPNDGRLPLCHTRAYLPWCGTCSAFGMLTGEKIRPK